MDLFFLPPFSFELMVQMIRKMLSPKSSVRDSNTVPRAPLPDSASGGSA
jgi:hypothetical protein